MKVFRLSEFGGNEVDTEYLLSIIYALCQRGSVGPVAPRIVAELNAARYTHRKP